MSAMYNKQLHPKHAIPYYCYCVCMTQNVKYSLPVYLCLDTGRIIYTC